VRRRRGCVPDDAYDPYSGNRSSSSRGDLAASEDFVARVGAAPNGNWGIIQGGSFAITFGSEIRRLCSLYLATAILALAVGVYTFPAQSPPFVPTVTFTKSLKGSSPEYMALSIDANGSGTYDSHKLGDPPTPRSVQISAGTTAQIFSLAHSLNDFRSLDLDSHHKVANMGLKSLTYQDGNENNKVAYNYTEKRAAQELTDIFEKIANVEEQISRLAYAIKYDHLSVPQELNQVQEALDDHNYIEPALMIPTLEKISTNPRMMHFAQVRAIEIVERIQQNK